MTTPEKPDADKPKPVFCLYKPPFTAEGLAEMFKRLTGRDVTPEGMEKFRKGCAEMAAKDAAKREAQK